MSIAVLTDSNSGITYKEAENLGIFLIPMPIIINGETYFEGESISESEFYTSLCGNLRVTTSQPSPGALVEYWEKILKLGYSQIVYIPMSSGLSSSCFGALSLSQDFNNQVLVVDNHRISVTLRDSVYKAKELSELGSPGHYIKSFLEKDSYNSTIYIALDTLEYLRRGGRVTQAGAAVANVLGIKPILTIQGEKLDAYTKARTMKRAMAKMVEAVKSDVAKRFYNIPSDRFSIGVAGSYLTKEDILVWKNTATEAFPHSKVYFNPLPLSIGCHVGPKAFGIGLSVDGNSSIYG